MITFKNFFVGFLISFIGSIPLGYLNVVGYEIYSKDGIYPTIYYLCGVVVIEFFVIFLTLIFAKKLMENKKLLQFIDAFSVLFMFALAYVFYASAISESTNTDLFGNYRGNYFVTGILLSCLNFIQILLTVLVGFILLPQLQRLQRQQSQQQPQQPLVYCCA